MITDINQENTEEKWHYIALKSIPTDDGFIWPTRSVSALFRKVTSNHNDDVFCFGCLQPHRTDSALKSHERLCNKHDYCEPVIPSEDKKILTYNPGDESINVKNTYIIYSKKSFAPIKVTKANINYGKKLGIIVITQENLEMLHTVFVIKGIRCNRKFL